MNKLVKKTLPEQIADILREEIRQSCAPGQLFPADAELTKRFGVSSLTLRAAINILAREGHLERAQGRRSIVKSRTAPGRHVAILSNKDLSLSPVSFFRLRTIQRLSRNLDAVGIPCKVYSGKGSPEAANVEQAYPEDFMRDVEAGTLSAVLAVNSTPATDWLEPLERNGVPVVGGGVPYQYQVVHDAYGLSLMAVKHFLDKGKRRIAMMGWGGDLLFQGKTIDTLKREAAKLMTTRKTVLPPEWFKYEDYPVAPGAGWRNLHAIWNARKEKPDALVIADDMLVPDTVNALLSLGVKIPEQLDVAVQFTLGSGLFLPCAADLLQIDADTHADAMTDMLKALLRGERPEPPLVVPPITLAHRPFNQ